MSDLRIGADLWANSMLPEGILERWLVPPGTLVRLGQPVATVRIEDALHDLMAPAAGRLKAVVMEHDVIEPGALVARIEPA